ncbi:MAG TPA: TfoX/Sxy family protein [Planctomycetota bacterium]|nr:TfoX/Sxy family protein [Planctomycetota bacterium]
MPVQDQYLAYVLEQLAALGSLRSNRMFGGIGLYSRELFFGLIDDDTLFFKTDDTNIAPYRERNMARFMPFPDRPEAVLGYHQVPADVIEDAEQLVDWARKSVDVALRSQVAKASRARRPAKRPVRKKSAPAKTAKRQTRAARAAPKKKPMPKRRAKKTARKAK